MRREYRVMDLRALRCFWATARLGGLTKAGVELGISESAVSQRLAALEGYLGVKLYQARGRRFGLTPAGEETFRMAAGLFDRLEDFEAGLVSADLTGEITLAAQDSVQTHLLMSVIERFKKTYPDVRLRLLSRTPEVAISMVRQDEVDLAIVPRRPVAQSLEFRPWCRFGAFLIGPKGHPLLRQARVSFDTLLNERVVAAHPLVVSESEGGVRRLERAFKTRGLPLAIGLEVGSMEIVKHYVARGLGLGLVSGICLVEEDGVKLDVVELPPEFRGSTLYGMIARKDKYMGGALTAFLEVLGLPSMDRAARVTPG